ncbi:MAG: DUF1428 domain-containing protein [Pseudomonadota bacterium]
MGYIDGVLCAVPTAKREEYLAFAKQAAALFKRHGALRVVDSWGDDVPDGKVNSLNSAVLRKADETVVFSWIEWPSKDVRNAAWAKVEEDPQMQALQLPYDGSRMVFGGFDMLLDA